MPLGLFTGRRSFVLTAAASGTDLAVEERFSGVLVPIITRSIADLQPSVERFAAAIKRMSEGERR